MNVNGDDCISCSKLGHLDVFDVPLYNDCDVVLLESLFDPDFEFEVNGQASVLLTDPNPTAPDNPLAFAFEVGTSNFTLRFEEISKFILPNTEASIGHAAPNFLAIFTGSGEPVIPTGNMMEDFLQPFLCTLLPTGEHAKFARADCVASLDPLTDQGFVPIITADGEAPLQIFTLSLNLNSLCQAEDLNFVGSDVVPGVLADGAAMGLGYAVVPFVGDPVNQQALFTATRVFTK